MSIVFFTFAGRTANMEVQRPHVTALLDDHPGSVLHLWDLTRKAGDQTYIRAWAASDERVTVMDQFHTGHPIHCRGPHRRGQMRCRCMIHKPPYEQPWRWYADTFRHQQDTTFVKFDDDVVWMDTPRFGEVLEFLETRPNAIASANVANNAVCAKYDPTLSVRVREVYGIGGDRVEYDKDWWNLHTDSSFAVLSHQWMLTNLGASVDREPVRTRPGERISINFVAMRYPTLRKVAGLMTDRLGDEGAVDALLPWIIPNFRVGHLSFGPQEVHPSSERWLNNLRNKYAQIPTNREVAR